MASLANQPWPAERPRLTASLITIGVEWLHIECTMNRYDKSREPFPVLYIGDDISIQPTMEHLRQLRDEITRFLEAEGT